jgi:hypothetical protein
MLRQLSGRRLSLKDFTDLLRMVMTRIRVDIGPSVSIRGSGVPSDHLGTGVLNSVTDSGAPLNCGFSRTGERGTSAPRVIPSGRGTENIRWRTQFLSFGQSRQNHPPFYFTSVTCSRASLYVPNFFATTFSVG